jgi:ubiquinone/menaquinone biosynthesis C-methylase UbiE
MGKEMDMEMERSLNVLEQDAVREKVRQGYAQIAESGRTGCCGGGATSQPSGAEAHGLGGALGSGGGGCCGTPIGAKLSAAELAAQIGYREEELLQLPEGANLGLSCGNPTAIAGLRAGQVVLDLGSGGGFDVFLAGPKVGAGGRVIGVDMTPAMLSKARKNAEHYRQATGLNNVEFRLGEIEHLPVADGSVDVVISNCVINLSPDKAQVWREIARVLAPGGTVAASDIALLRELPDSVRGMLEAYVGCIAGAVLVNEYRAMVEAAGLKAVALTPKPQYIAALMASDDPLYGSLAKQLPAGTTPMDFVTSLDVTAQR